MGGGDLRWNTPLTGFLAGASFLTQHPSGSAETMIGAGFGMGTGIALSANQEAKKNQISQFYVQYNKGALRIDGEYRRDYRDLFVQIPAVHVTEDLTWNARSWYVSAAYRISPRLEVGSYYSRFVPQWGLDPSSPDNHIYDKVVSARFDLTRFWTIKVEGHFMDGYGALDSSRGFYDFPGLRGGVNTTKPQTNLLMIRTGFSF
jgi:hypothetical protein